MATLQEMVDELSGSDKVSNMVYRAALSGLPLKRINYVPQSKVEKADYLTKIARFVVILLDSDTGTLSDSEKHLARIMICAWLNNYDVDPKGAGL